MLGRLHGVPTPINAALCTLAERQARSGAGPGGLSVDEVRAIAANTACSLASSAGAELGTRRCRREP
jgi:hypothetical protein